MTVYTVRRGAESYGHAIGILLVECRTPFIPGDVGNASTYPFPVVYLTVPNVTLTRLIDEGDKSLAGQVVAAAKKLEDLGVRAIASDCGYMIHFQAEVAAAVRVPAILSSLIQLPMLERSLGPNQRIGLICANRRRLTPDMLVLAGLSDPDRVIIRGMENSRPFRSPILDEEPQLDDELIERDITALAAEMTAAHPEIGLFLLECSNMPPYAHAIQKTTGRPVFDFTTLIGLYQSAAFRRPFTGFY
ncbi:MAG: aspartate/glutamate racemase family protein [Candidatus Adiutrix sp.]|jgi:hypothetical protein|nr:aspartate/glutamate racemase family protein [Candidatus Adiutrix sp.]